ncbi:MAG: RecX family transcriptional regulator [Ruminococcus sp.]|nr:RecX family transcriptional regulator [Ruminococcus sp.]
MNRDDPLYKRARERALYLLDYRDHCYAEIVTKLLRKYDEDIAYGVADELADKGLIDDLRFAENNARQLIEVKLYGVYRARMQLRQRGVPRSVIDEVLEQYSEGAAERAKALIERRYTKYWEPEDRAQMLKQTAALVRQGYSFDEVKTAIELIKAEEYEE